MKRRKPASLTDAAVDLGPDIRRRTILAADRTTVLREPTAEAGEWRDPDDDNPQRRKARTISGSRAADPLQAMAMRGKLVTERHLKAAQRLLDDWEFGVLGARPSSVKTGGGGYQAAQYPEEARLAHLADARAARAAVGERGFSVLAHVVLGIPEPEQRTVRAYAQRHGMHEQTATGLLFGALERLAEHYLPAERSAIVEANEQKARAAG